MLYNNDPRRTNAALNYITFKGNWGRDHYGRWSGERINAPIIGPFGQLVVTAIESKFDGGKGRDVYGEKNGASVKVGEGYPRRWLRLCQTADPGINIMQRLAGGEQPGVLAVLYRRPIRDNVQGAVWPELRKAIGLDAVLLEKQAIGIACDSAGVGVTIETRGSIPGLHVFAPHEVTFRGASWNSAECVVAIHHRDHSVVVSDISGVEPRFGEWRTVEEFDRGYAPMWELSGAAYPFRYMRRPLTHIIPTPGRGVSLDLQPDSSALRNLTLDTILRFAWADLVAMVGSFNRVAVTSRNEPDGMDELSMDVSNVSALWGSDNIGLEVIPHGMDAAEKFEELAMRRLQSQLSAYDGDLRVRDGGQGVQSGRAIEIERAGLADYARQQEQTQRPSDIRILELAVGTWNWMVVSRLIDQSRTAIPVQLIPETPIEVNYPLAWAPHELKQIIAELEPVDPVGAHVLRMGGDFTDEEARAVALNQLRRASAERLELVRAGYGVPAQDLYQLPAETAPVEPVAEAPESDDYYDVPVPVSAEATRGLQLFARFNRPGTPADQRRGSTSARRVGALLKSGRVEYDVLVEMQALGGDALRSRDLPGWGDTGNPSSEWIDYLCYGGDAGQEWIADEFDDEEEPTAPEEDEVAISAAAPKKYGHINFKPPASAAENARRGLELRDKFGRGGTAIGIARGRDIANRKTLSPRTVRRMKAYFDRHQGDKRAGWSDPSKPSNGYIAWQLWGGDAGYAWVRKVVRQMEAADKN